jgi:diguanylate cyclase (GGDEF)-like protein
VGSTVYCVFEDSAKNVWVGTDMGVNRFSGQKVQQFSERDGLYGETVYDILEDDKGNIWFFTNRGVNRFNGRIIESYVGLTEFLGDIILRGAWRLDPQGRLWIGTNRGACLYQPDRDKPNLVEPTVRLSSIKLDGKPLLPKNGRYVFREPFQTLEIGWVGLSFKDEQGVRYKFLLDGFDPQWSEVCPDNRIRYTHLPSGSYSFKVLARNHDGVWSSQPLILPLEVQPPFWATPLFLAGAALLALGIGLVSYRYRVRTLHRTMSLLGDKVQARTRELDQTIAELERKNILLEEMAITDSMTSLFNHQYLLRQLKLEFEKSRRTGLPLTLVMTDIDFFKEVNDRHGHMVGDRVLQEFASILRRESRSIDLAARYRGEEFALLLINTDAHGAMVFVEKQRQKIQEVAFGGELAIHLTASFGVATESGFNFLSEEELIIAADSALYKAKRFGRNRVEVWEAPPGHRARYQPPSAAAPPSA